ncbi:hypothetical protein BV22DRAFT_1196742 [Leucogyrophana mollusca]|uniref:Uncharacterized protein n=1 Tax=Leucogyrophana mollusca TaxID=85980 RepID=A0ACB8BF72_9AGAM|nr:hypothetical protein BV22DRAFT_1196742 [Leucogyrophana mollusca]
MSEGHPGYLDEVALRQQRSGHISSPTRSQNVSVVLSVPQFSPSTNNPPSFQGTNTTTSHPHSSRTDNSDAQHYSLPAPYGVYSTSLPPLPQAQYHDPVSSFASWPSPADEFLPASQGGMYDSRGMRVMYTPSYPAPSPYPQPVAVAQAPPPETGLPRCALAGSLDPTTGIFYRTPEHPRLRTAQACEKCRVRKAKCTGEHPACQRCRTRGLMCQYAPEGRIRGPNKPKIKPILPDTGSDSEYSENSVGKEDVKERRTRARGASTSSVPTQNQRARLARPSLSLKKAKVRRASTGSEMVKEASTDKREGDNANDTPKAETTPAIVSFNVDKTPTLEGGTSAVPEKTPVPGTISNLGTPVSSILPSTLLNGANTKESGQTSAPTDVDGRYQIPSLLMSNTSSAFTSDSGSDCTTSYPSSAGPSSHSTSPTTTRCSSSGPSIPSPTTPDSEPEGLLDISHPQYPDDIQSLFESPALASREGEWGTTLGYGAYEYGAWADVKAGERWEDRMGFPAPGEEHSLTLEYPMDFSMIH